MPLDLITVDRVDDWDGLAGSQTVWIVRGTTIEEQPRLLVVRTVKPFHASLCERAMKTKHAIWIGWREGRRGTKDITTVKLDETKFQQDAR